ncbi:MAG: tetratricopeptide repeat protein [Magnetococcales bacterium]|nr:tetratricopeptide repeat protein [Magnetococcales bacterium]
MTGHATLLHLKALLEADPAQERHWLNYLEALMNGGHLEVAGQMLEQGRRSGLQGEGLESLAERLVRESEEMNRIIGCFNQGLLSDVERLAGTVTERCPGHGLAWKLLGLARMGQGEMAAAVAPLRNAREALPRDDEVHRALGLTWYALERHPDAERAFRHSLAIVPDDPVTLYNLGNLLKLQGRLEEAESSYGRALELQPDFAQACNNLGLLLCEQDRLPEAGQLLRRAVALAPDYFDGLYNLGNTLDRLGEVVEAEAAFLQALRIKPDAYLAWNNLGNLLAEQKRYEEAEAAYRRTLAIQPDYGNALGHACFYAQYNCNWQNTSSDVHAISKALERGVAVPPFTLLSCLDDGLLLRRASGLSCAELVGPILTTRFLVEPKPYPRRERLRIGYLSADFRNHPVTQVFAGVLEKHDRDRFVVYCYAYGVETQDEGRQRITRSCDILRNLVSLSDAESAARIVGDGIDILVDFTGYTQFFRPGIIARRPAPIIVNFGFPGSLGHPRMADYRISDPIVSPPHMAEHFSETLALLPNCFQVHERERTIDWRQTRIASCLPEDGFIFCSFNQNYKFSAAIFELWCRLLHAVGDSVLWLPEAGMTAMTNLRQEATRHGVDSGRLLFAPRTRTLAEHLGRLSLADLALDTFPFTSHTTGGDALLSGVPLITRIGDSFVSRVAASMLHAAGLPELVTHSWEEYYELALDLARNPHRLQALRERLWLNRSTHPLFDTERFTRDLERLYERMWLDHGQGKREMIVLKDGEP